MSCAIYPRIQTCTIIVLKYEYEYNVLVMHLLNQMSAGVVMLCPIFDELERFPSLIIISTKDELSILSTQNDRLMQNKHMHTLFLIQLYA